MSCSEHSREFTDAHTQLIIRVLTPRTLDTLKHLLWPFQTCTEDSGSGQQDCAPRIVPPPHCKPSTTPPCALRNPSRPRRQLREFRGVTVATSTAQSQTRKKPVTTTDPPTSPSTNIWPSRAICMPLYQCSHVVLASTLLPGHTTVAPAVAARRRHARISVRA